MSDDINITPGPLVYVPADKWQPIETAPKDGTFVLVGWTSNGSGRSISGEWLSVVAKWKPAGHWQARYGSVTGYRASHWMPLPEPPK